PATTGAQREPRALPVGLGVAMLAIAYLVASAQDWPLGIVAVAGAGVLIAIDAATGGWAPRVVANEVPWGLFPLFAGLILLVTGAERAGLFAPLQAVVAYAAGLDGLGTPLMVATLALLANVVNNLPAALAGAS